MKHLALFNKRTNAVNLFILFRSSSNKNVSNQITIEQDRKTQIK